MSLGWLDQTWSSWTEEFGNQSTHFIYAIEMQMLEIGVSQASSQYEGSIFQSAHMTVDEFMTCKQRFTFTPLEVEKKWRYPLTASLKDMA